MIEEWSHKPTFSCCVLFHLLRGTVDPYRVPEIRCEKSVEECPSHHIQIHNRDEVQLHLNQFTDREKINKAYIILQIWFNQILFAFKTLA